MTDLRTVLHDIADDSVDLDAVRRRLRRPRHRRAPLLAAAAVVAVALAAAATTLADRDREAPSHTDPVTVAPGTGADTTSAPVTTVTSTAGDAAVGTPPGSAAPGATAVVVSASPTDPWSAVCFGTADLSTDLRVGASWAQKAGRENTAPRPEDYFDICGTHWQTGTWSMEPSLNPDYSAPPAPAGLELTACILPDGTYGILPGTDATCTALGLPIAIAPDPGLGVIEESAPTS